MERKHVVDTNDVQVCSNFSKNIVMIQHSTNLYRIDDHQNKVFHQLDSGMNENMCKTKLTR